MEIANADFCSRVEVEPMLLCWALGPEPWALGSMAELRIQFALVLPS